MVHFACRRHKLERDYNAAWKAVFPEATKQPADPRCEKVFKLYEAGKFPKTLDEKSGHVMRLRSPFFLRQKARLEELAAKMDATGEKDGCIPRDDYRLLLNLVKVYNQR